MPRHGSAVGLDIGRHSVKAVRLVRALGRCRLAGAEVVNLPAGEVARAEIIQRFLESKGMLNDPCAVCLAGRSVMLNVIQVPEHDPRSMDDIARIEIDRLHELAEQDMLYDYVGLPEISGEREILLAMSRREAVDGALRVPDAMGLDVVRMLPVPVAVFNSAVAHDAGGRGAVACADIGHSATVLAVGGANGLLFARRFDIGGALFTEAVRESTGLSPSEAEDRKIRYGFEPAGKDLDQEVRDGLERAASQWVDEFTAALSLYRERHSRKEDEPKVLVLSGGGAELSGLKEYLEGRLEIKIRGLDPPWAGQRVSNTGRFAVAAGLALSVLGKGRVGLNLLPATRKQALALRGSRKYWIAAGLAAILALAACLAGLYADFLRKRVYLASAERRLTEFEGMERDVNALTTDNSRLIERLRFAHRGMRDGMILRAVIGALANAMDKEDWVVLVADSHSYFGTARADRPEGELNGRGPGQGEGRLQQPQFLESVIVEGYTPHEDFSTVRTMIEKLREVVYIEDADLLTDDRLRPDPERDEEWAEVGERLFAVEIKVRQP